MEMFHATIALNVSSITRNNRDWRRSVRTKVGEGVSFSPDARYANQHCNRNNPTRRAMLYKKVTDDDYADHGVDYDDHGVDYDYGYA